MEYFTAVIRASLLMIVVFSDLAAAKIFDKCELAALLMVKHNMTRDQVKNWVCIAQYESTFNTSAINHFNWDGSQDYGLFQLNDMYWCGAERGKNVCRMPCQDLLDDDLSDDLRCIKLIIKDIERWKGKGTGLTAWVAYVNKCQTRDLDSYMSECWSQPDSIDSNIISDVSTGAIRDSEPGGSAGPSAAEESIVPIPVARIPVAYTHFHPMRHVITAPLIAPDAHAVLSPLPVPNAHHVLSPLPLPNAHHVLSPLPLPNAHHVLSPLPLPNVHHVLPLIRAFPSSPAVTQPLIIAPQLHSLPTAPQHHIRPPRRPTTAYSMPQLTVHQQYPSLPEDSVPAKRGSTVSRTPADTHLLAPHNILFQ